jgi:hypothetical protein
MENVGRWGEADIPTHLHLPIFQSVVNFIVIIQNHLCSLGLLFSHKYLLFVPNMASKEVKVFVRVAGKPEKARKAIRLATKLEIMKRIEGGH